MYRLTWLHNINEIFTGIIQGLLKALSAVGKVSSHPQVPYMVATNTDSIRFNHYTNPLWVLVRGLLLGDTRKLA